MAPIADQEWPSARAVWTAAARARSLAARRAKASATARSVARQLIQLEHAYDHGGGHPLTPPSLPARCVQTQFCDLSFGGLPGAVCRRIDVVTCDFTPTPLPVQPGCPGQQSDNRGQEEQQIDHY